ncbi:Hdr-like menaquinol oxidoreductase cytochrome c subunit [uncultured delta proteobacterium]|uniref:Hdr-like menaquinol oxidoreductase cytochrome c subunit n=1 Tax=uncultured delta proteobacterium TaxID=34034 RepID=A0A212KEJ6_9DELT|nr:Hdr-like menaquinol oxidoreductase cytochrome c subunit [uncultured delta proteobacterium]
MYNRRYIIPGIVAFVVACLFPFLLNVAAKPYSRPALELPQGEKACIEPTSVMQSEHMRILIEWRDAAIRDGKRSYVASDGKIWEASLQNTCMKCHANQQQFCGSCHDANSVRPDCWTCHVKPETPGAKRIAANGGKMQ